MNYRAIDKQYLKSYLETVVFDGKSLPVFTKHTISDATPYCLVTSAALVPNEGSGSMHDNGNYKRGYRYSVQLVWKARQGEEETQVTEDSVDELEADIIDLLQSMEVRDCKELTGETTRSNKWLDLEIDGEISAPFSGTKIALDENHFVKTFPVKIQHMHAYD